MLYDPSLHSYIAEHTGLLVNVIPGNLREILKEEGLSDEALDGSLTALSQLLGSNVNPLVNYNKSERV